MLFPGAEKERLRRGQGRGGERQGEQRGNSLEVQRTWCDPEADRRSGGWGVAPGEGRDASRSLGGLASPSEDFGLAAGQGCQGDVGEF